MLNSKCIFVLKNDISKGEVITYDSVQKVIVKNLEQEELVCPYDCIAKFDLKKGQILNNDIISEDKDDIVHESIIIPLNNNVSELKKGKFVNIYITTKIKNIKKENLVKYSFIINKNSKEITMKIINNQRILNVYKDGENKTYIVIEVEKDVALLIENIKDISKFSLSIVERGD